MLLRQTEPESYQKILEMAEGEAAEAARNDPDAFVAIFLSYAEEAGFGGAPEPVAAKKVQQAWPVAPPEDAPDCSGSSRKPHPPVKCLPVEDPFEPTYRCPTCGREQHAVA